MVKKSNFKFPLIEAFLLTPEEGVNGNVGICTNTTSPGQVLNEIEEKNRNKVSVLGPLIANRDGVERMILNSLVHPKMRYLILFSEETLTFSPSTNLLLALQNGIDKNNQNNINSGVAMSSYYPSLSKKIVDIFNNEIIVLPIFMYKNDYSSKIINDYIEYIKDRITPEVYKFLIKTNSSKKIYYNSLNELIGLINQSPNNKKNIENLDPKDFQHLQPPIIEIKTNITEKENVSFNVSSENKKIRLDIKIKDDFYFIKDEDDFLIGYSLMKFLKNKKTLLSDSEQLLLGAELSRIKTEIESNIKFPSFVKQNKIKGEKEILLESQINLIPDKEYYYLIGLKGNTVSVKCLAFDLCKDVFDLRSNNFQSLINWIINKNRFENYEMDILHRIDIGNQIGRAIIALDKGYSFIQDFSHLFKENRNNLPLTIIDGDNFLDVHRNLLMKIYTLGITEEHGDKHKGLARTASALAIYRNTTKSLKSMPLIYKQGDIETEEVRKKYKEQLLRFDYDGSYSYGERTRSYFGIDQLEEVSNLLKENKNKALAIQRFDPSKDMGIYTDKKTGETKYTHDPCLTHDIFFVQNNKLHSFHIARAHNTVNAYPENVFGLYDAYISTISSKIGLEKGDMYMLSNRANILLLTEEQRLKKIISEPSKPMSDLNNLESGPYKVGDNIKIQEKNNGIFYTETKLEELETKPKNKILEKLINFNNINIIERAIKYLKTKGVSHNNPILSSYIVNKSNPLDDHLIFFQANMFGGKIHATAVFINHKINLKEDKKLLNYISTMYKKELDYELGNLNIFYIKPL